MYWDYIPKHDCDQTDADRYMAALFGANRLLRSSGELGMRRSGVSNLAVMPLLYALTGVAMMEKQAVCRVNSLAAVPG